MTHYQNQYGVIPLADEYGNQIRQADEAGYGSYQTGHTTGGLGTGTGITTGYHERGHHGHHGHHHDDGLSSSYPDQDERTGQTKGMKERIKENIPGMGHEDARHHYAGSNTTPGGTGGYDMSSGGQYQHEHGHEKKGVMHIPGMGHKYDRSHYAGSTTTPGGPGGYDMSSEGQYQHGHGHNEKKGVMHKIKEKLPGYYSH